jgi:hypothetical protein
MEVNVGLDPDDVTGGDLAADRLRGRRHEPGVEVSPDVIRLFQIWVHPRER